jgi:hypothetical protein
MRKTVLGLAASSAFAVLAPGGAPKASVSRRPSSVIVLCWTPLRGAASHSEG